MLPKKKRIPRKIFNPLIQSGKYFNSEHFSLKTAPSSTTRIAVSVSKKISKSAVIRNKVRRRAYSALRELLPTLPEKLFLLIAKPGAEKTKGVVLKTELAELFKKG